MKSIKTAIHIFITLAFVGLFYSCAIKPLAWHAPEKPAFVNEIEFNKRLTQATKIDLLGYAGAEEFAMDSKGNIYCGAHKSEKDFSAGAIIKITPEGRAEEFLKTDKWVTGLQFDLSNNLIALMNGVGLIKIKSDKTIDTLLMHTPGGEPLLMGTGLKIASDGKIYFANMSSTNETSPKYINKLILEMKPTGGIYCFDPISNKTTIISSGNYFGNGLELACDESFLLVSETSKYRIIKYWLKGEKAGTSEILLDNLPGFPNNISRRRNGNFWIGFTTKRNDQLDQIHHKPGMKKFVYGLPQFMQPKAEKFGMVLEITQQGKIVQALFDTKGKTVTEAGAVSEWNNSLYLGGDNVRYVSKIRLD